MGLLSADQNRIEGRFDLDFENVFKMYGSRREKWLEISLGWGCARFAAAIL